MQLLETAFERSKFKRGMFTVAKMQTNFMHYGKDYFHHGYSCYFGRHHIYCNHVEHFGTRKPGVIDVE
eukprot:15362975-Ditylum_brightwellii.AAC.1